MLVIKRPKKLPNIIEECQNINNCSAKIFWFNWSRVNLNFALFRSIYLWPFSFILLWWSDQNRYFKEMHCNDGLISPPSFIMSRRQSMHCFYPLRRNPPTPLRNIIDIKFKSWKRKVFENRSRKTCVGNGMKEMKGLWKKSRRGPKSCNVSVPQRFKLRSSTRWLGDAAESCVEKILNRWISKTQWVTVSWVFFQIQTTLYLVQVFVHGKMVKSIYVRYDHRHIW